MSESDPNFDMALQQAYQKRKAKTQVPAAIKQHVMTKARREEKGRSGMSFSGWFWQLGAAASVVLFFVIYMMPEANQPMQESNQVTWLEVKSADKTERRRLSGVAEFNRIEQRYAQRQTMITADRQLARLTYTDGEQWTFETCDEREIILSGELLMVLQKYELVVPDIYPGNPVMIGFDDKGLITGIDDSDQALVCD